jgi:glucose-6-phosphate-specific signal transduction histidine kinase
MARSQQRKQQWRRQRRRDGLLVAAVAFLAANLLHSADHLRQGLDGVSSVVLAGGGVITASAVAVVVLAQRRHVSAPLAAALVGFATAVLVTSSHVVPHWSVLSDSYVDDVSVDALSWAVVLLEIATALVLGWAGASRLRDTARYAVPAHG